MKLTRAAALVVAVYIFYKMTKSKMQLAWPTSNKMVRNCDPFGCGNFGAGRGSRDHVGEDFVVVEHQPIFSPISGKVIRESIPYASDASYRGILIENEQFEVKMFYLKPNLALIGKTVKAGDLIGYAQNISKKYGPTMIPHVHVQIKDLVKSKFFPISELLK